MQTAAKLWAMSLTVGLAGFLGCADGAVNGVGSGSGERPRSPMADAYTGTDLARAFFEERVAPLMQSQCVSCHDGGDPQAPVFLKSGPEMFATLTATRPPPQRSLISVVDPASSLVLTKGQHAGPPWSERDKTVVLEWLQLMSKSSLEALANRPRVMVVEGSNTVALGTAFPGASVSFLWSKVEGLGSYNVSGIKVNGGCLGVELLHPTLVLWRDGAAIFKEKDSLKSFGFTVAPGATSKSDTNWIYTVDPQEFPTDGVSFLFERLVAGAGNPASPIAGC